MLSVSYNLSKKFCKNFVKISKLTTLTKELIFARTNFLIFLIFTEKPTSNISRKFSLVNSARKVFTCFWRYFAVFLRVRWKKGVFIRFRIQSECRKMRTRITPNMNFFYAVFDSKVTVSEGFILSPSTASF